MSMRFDEAFLRQAIELGFSGMRSQKGGPFGALVVKDGKVLATGCNQVTSSYDPTAHAEVVAIRAACSALGDFQLTDCHLYSSCEPCPMCLGAMYWARPSRVFFASSRQDAAQAGFDDEHIYKELVLPLEDRSLSIRHCPHPKADELFQEWKNLSTKTPY